MEDSELDAFIQSKPEEVESTKEGIELSNRIIENVLNLPKLILKLESQAVEQNSLNIVLNLIKDILIKKGSIFDTKILTELSEKYFSIISSISPFLISNQLVSIASDIAAYFYRYIYEKSVGPPPFVFAYDLAASDAESSIILGFNILISVLIIMKKPMKNSPSKIVMNNKIKSFERSQISEIFRIALGQIDEQNPKIISIAIDLIIGIFKFLKSPLSERENETEKKKEEIEDKIEYDVPKDMYTFYLDFSFPQKFFELYLATKSTKAIDAIRYFSGVSKSSWLEMGISPFAYINEIEPNLMGVIETLSEEQQFYSVSALIYKLGKLISITPPNSGTNISDTFIENIQRFTLQLFPNFSNLSESCFCLLKFWGIISNNYSFIEMYKEPMTQIHFSICEAFINSLIQLSLNDMSFDEFMKIVPDFNDFIENCMPLLKISELSFEKVAEMIKTVLMTYTGQLQQGLEISFYPISILLLIITSFIDPQLNLSIHFDMNIIQFISLMIQLFLGFITETNPIESDMITAYPSQSYLLENCILCFSKKFINFFLVSNIKTKIFELIEMSEQQVFDLLINRLLTDLSLLNGFPDLLISILNFFIEKSSAPKFPNLSSSNQLFQMLVSRQLSIAFEHVEDFEQLYRLVSLLTRMYSMAASLDQMGNFVSPFDEQFEHAASKQFADPRTALVLFRQISGALKGTTAIVKYTYLFRWMLHNHADHTLQCIAAQCNEPIVIKAILKVWINMCLGNNLQLPSYSADGLLLIKVAAQILDLVDKRVEKNDEIMNYIVKMLNACITTKNSNFGIMKLYEDDTIDHIIALFLQIIKFWPFDVYSKYKNMLNIISSTFDFIFNYSPSLFEDEDNLNCLLYFYARSLLEIEEFASDEFKCVYEELYKNFTLIIKFFFDNAVEGVFPKLQTHLMILLDTLFVSSSKTIHEISDLVFMLAKPNAEFLEAVTTHVVETFDESFRPIIASQFNKAFKHLKKERPNEKFAKSLEQMCTLLKPYSIRLSEIEEYREEFEKLTKT